MGYVVVLLVLLSWTAISSCNTIAVSSDYDQAANFHDLKTYAWMTAKEKLDNTGVQNSLVMSRIQDAVDRQLDVKGYQKVAENSDFFVAYHASVDEKTQIHSMSYYGGGVGVYGGGGLHNDVYQTHYEEGTLIIDILDSEKKNLLWRGIAKGIVDTQDDSETKTKRINNAVQKMLDLFPPK